MTKLICVKEVTKLVVGQMYDTCDHDSNITAIYLGNVCIDVVYSEDIKKWFVTLNEWRQMRLKNLLDG